MNWKYILLLIIVIFVFSGGILIYQSLSVSKEKSNIPVVTLPPTSENSATQTPAISQEPPPSNIVDCGIIDANHFFNEPDKLTAQEKTSISCIVTAIINCRLSTFNYSGSLLEVKRKEGTLCAISNYVKPSSSELAGSGTKTCRIPISFLSEVGSIGTDTNTQKGILLALTFAIRSGQATNNTTGQILKFDCK